MSRKKILKATHDGVIKIGDLEIDCAVLEDETRVISERAFTRALGGKRGGAHWIRKRKLLDGAKLPVFLSANNLKSFIPDDLATALSEPIAYVGVKGGQANGVEAKWIPKILEVWLQAKDADELLKSQEHFAVKAGILMRGLAHIGIIALVDEATGYQYDRAREALEQILEQFIAKELFKWVKTFPDEFYQELFRLRGWQYSSNSIKRPMLVGKLTNNLVYERLAPGVLDELKTLNPKTPKGTRRHHHHRWLTRNFGHPRLREHLSAVVALMKASAKWDDFKRMINRALPKYGDFPLIEYAERQAKERDKAAL